MLNKKTVDDINVKGKRVLVRCDFNVPLIDGKITDENRLVAALPTIKKLIADGGKVILCSHLGKPKGEPKPELSLAPVAVRLSELLGQKVKFAADPEVVGPNAKAAVEAMKDGDVILLENTRYRAEETKNGEEFSKELASLCDVFVNDAFGTAHRAHCSNVGVTKYVDTAVVGYLMEKEIAFLGNAVNNPERPFVAILGGSKVSSKISVIDNLIDKVDVLIIGGDHRVSVITGPNMAGKSTYMRQTALIVLMAQIGSFVPASKANIGIVDRIFTRVGASDDLASGQSTFMVEMTEVANILRNATSNSLLILDEIGRGTSTFDGLSIAWAVIEHVANPKLLGAKTLFATHYHELTELEGKLPGVHNYCIAVKEKGDDIVFLRKIVQGGADKSYGIQVARLAGVPESVLSRAQELVEQLSDADITAAVKDLTMQKKPKAKPVHYDEVDMAQMSLFDTVQDDDIIKELSELDISNMTPMDALNTLYRFQGKVKNRWK